jgi:hypothetical protein
MVKICSLCLIEKELSFYYKQSKSSDGYKCWCKDCDKLYRQKNLSKYRLHAKNKRIKRIKFIQEIKFNVPCKDCGNIYEPYCMDFDHVTGNKIKAVSRMALEGYSEEDLLKEINKCDLVCLLCHNKRTNKKYEKTKYKSYVLRNINIIREFKNTPCVMCGNLYEHYNMQADHVNPKLHYICNLKSCKLQILLDELKKCQVLCALCHRRKSILEQKKIYNFF